MNKLIVITLFFIKNLRDTLAASSSLVAGGHCRDYNGKLYESGMHYMPGPDSCRLCICDSGLPKACKMVLCEAFTKCKSFQTRKIRARESRQNAEDQRSIVGSIGYIAGNMGYMEGNLSGMDYSYGGTSSHYPLWKPPSGYFPRGEAPPPYEEAVAISQAEALSAQCTVSVATTTHRSLPVGINAVDMSNDVRRAQVAQPQQQHPSQSAVAQIQPQPSQHHQQSITQSTTNLINININSGGNLTTIATGESHQPPYSCISSVNQPCSTQTPTNCSSALGTLSDVNAVAAASNNGRLHLPNNSICVQTTAPPLPSAAAIHSAHHQQNFQQAQQQMQYQQRTQQQQQQMHLHQQQQQQQQQQQMQHQQQQQQQHQQQQSHSLQQTNCIQITECTYKNCHLNSSNRRMQKPHPAQEMIHYVSNASTGVTFQAITSERNDSESKPEQMTSPQYTAAECNGRMQEISTITSSETVAAQTSSLKTANKTPSSSRRYHRTIPRYFAVVDPLGQAAQQMPKPLSSSAASSKASSTNSGPTSSSGTSSSGNNMNSKKPTCQCPVQHVPMSYMGTNQINSSQTNNVFLAALSTKLVTNRSGFGPKCMQPGTPTASSKSSNSISANELTSNGSSGTMKRNTAAGISTQNNQSNVYGQHDTKIATISKQVGDLKTETPTFETHAILQPYGGGDDKVHSSHRGKISCSSSSSKLTNSPKLIPESTSIYSSGNLNTVPLSYPEANPALPPKMYKSQTSLKSPSASAATQLFQKAPIPGVGINSSDVTNQIPTISHQKSQFTKSLPRKEDKNTPPALTLPISGQLSTEKSQSLGKINSSTFYPLQNNHVTYTLPKHTSGKMSLNSTIASVVSKVPSVISIPVSDDSNAPRMKSQPQSPNHKASPVAQGAKCTTLPKTLRSAAKKVESISTTTASAAAATATPATPSSSCSNPKSLDNEKPLPVCTTSKNCLNPKEHFLPNDTSLDDDYLSECENCKIAHSSKYYLDEEIADSPQETMTLQRKMDDKEEQEQAYYRISHTLPTNPKKNPTIKNNTREPWFSTIPASSSSEEEINE